MAGKVYLGCAVWAHRGWLGRIYPTGTPAKQFLSLYSHCFNTVEGNSTFYAAPKQELLYRWRQETHAEFRFALKLPKEISHAAQLAPKVTVAQQFIEQMQAGLGDRLGCIFVQLPPSYSPSHWPDLQEFLSNLPRSTPLALEVRHRSWFSPSQQPQLEQFLHQQQIAQVLLDSRPVYADLEDPRLVGERHKPNLPVHFSDPANHILVRYISHPDRNFNHNYMHLWADQISNWYSQGKTVYFFIHCPLEDYSPNNAKYFQELLAEKGIEIFRPQQQPQLFE